MIETSNDTSYQNEFRFLYEEEWIDYFDVVGVIPLVDNDLVGPPDGFDALHGLYTHDF